jgi:hypothetical protein
MMVPDGRDGVAFLYFGLAVEDASLSAMREF